MKWNPETPVYQSALGIVRRLRDAGYQALWVGGCVRDALLGEEAADIDIATNAPPEIVESLFPRHVSVGAQFGVILVLDGDVETEVATFRSDGEYLDSRHPTCVTFGSPLHDALRRDFTINALFYDPIEQQVIDHVGGKGDLDARILRAIGEPLQRFEEDALRLMRAVRFAVRFDLTIELATYEAITQLAPHIKNVSGERVRDELVRMMTGPHPGNALRLLNETGLLQQVLPEVADESNVPQPENFHPEGDVFVHTALAMDHLPANPSPTLAISTLLHDIGKPRTITYEDRIRFNLHHTVGAEMADAACRRLRFSNADRKQIVELVEHHMDFLNIYQMRPARLRRLLAMNRFDEHLELHRADCLASHGDISNYDFCKCKIEEFAREDAEPILPAPLVNGDDLIALGYKPGPEMGKMLAAIREAQLNGELHTKESALEWVKSFE